MRRQTSALWFLVLVLLTAACGRSASAADDTWVSATGVDSGACTIVAPCRKLGYALSQTSSGGSIIIVSSGRFPPITIDKSVRIVAEGVEADIAGTAPCGGAICIQAGANDVVSLQGITVDVDIDNKQSDGIVFLSGGALHLEKCKIKGWPLFGLRLASANSASFDVLDSDLAANGETVRVQPGSGLQHIVFDHANLQAGLHGLVFDPGSAGAAQVAVRDSTITGIDGSSILMATSIPVDLMLDHVVLANGENGIHGAGGSNVHIRMGNSMISNYAVEGASDRLESYGTNKVVDSDDFYPDGDPLRTIPLK